MARIVVCGYMVRHPVAGNLLAFFQYVLGLVRLGHEVVYLEESGWPYSCYDPELCEYIDSPEKGLRIVRALMSQYQLNVPTIYVNRDSTRIDGADQADLHRVLNGADLLLNVGGVCWLPEFHLCGRRAMIDMDPLFTQVAKFGAEMLCEHDVHFSYGTNIGRPGCTIPTAGIDWLSTVPPVVIDFWKDVPPPDDAAPFTTIANWGAYGGIQYNGDWYGQKDEEFLRVIDLPRRATRRLELAISGAGEPVRERLRSAGWIVRDAGREVSVDLPTYRSYIAHSRGEFSVAKNAYVKTRSGWFSDRSACYLAAGRPIVVQDTGFASDLPDHLLGKGLLTFSTIDQAVECLESIERDYAGHRVAAVEVARRVFSHEVVLPRILSLSMSAYNGRRQASGLEAT